jgi:hypothetical protein
LGDFAAALRDLEHVLRQDPGYDYHRAAGLLAHVYASVGQGDRAAALFEQVLQVSTLSETQYNYASLLASRGRSHEARQWAQQILSKRPTLPRYLRRVERPWFRRASELLRRVPDSSHS